MDQTSKSPEPFAIPAMAELDPARPDAPACCPKPGQAPTGPVPPPSPCCRPSEKQSREIPGYRLQDYVTGWIDAKGRQIPQVATKLSPADRWGAVRMRLGIGRSNYRMTPGLYAVGRPGGDSEILVSANYKLSFDSLRRELAGQNAWILVLDTQGINVWCAAGKRTFSTAEVVRRIRESGLAEITPKREIILPQLGAPGVAGYEVKRQTGFKATFGPVRAADLPRFLAEGKKADAAMRRVRFALRDRLAVTPVEVSINAGLSGWAALSCLVLGGIGPDVFSPMRALISGGAMFAALILGFIAGNFLAPALLPVLPGRAFALKGAQCGAGLAILILAAGTGFAWTESLAQVLACVASASWFTMNYTGNSTFTSPSGVEKEMRRFIPFQAAAFVLALCAWIVPRFIQPA